MTKLNMTGKTVSMSIPNWVSDIKKNYPAYIKKIDDVKIVNINNVRFLQNNNKARKHTINQNVKNSILESFERDGWLETEEPAVLIKTIPDASVAVISTQKDYEG